MRLIQLHGKVNTAPDGAAGIDWLTYLERQYNLFYSEVMFQ